MRLAAIMTPTALKVPDRRRHHGGGPPHRYAETLREEATPPSRHLLKRARCRAGGYAKGRAYARRNDDEPIRKEPAADP